MTDIGRDQVGNDSSGKDLTRAGIGEDAKNNAVGSGIQSFNVDFSTLNPSQQERLFNIVFGDGMRWDGITLEMRKLESNIETIRKDIASLAKITESNTGEIKRKLAEFETRLEWIEKDSRQRTAIREDTKATIQINTTALWILIFSITLLSISVFVALLLR